MQWNLSRTLLCVSTCLGVSTCLTLPAVAQDPAPLISRLHDGDIRQRIAAARKLALMGDVARVALERLLIAPEESSLKQASAGQHRRIATLIARWGASRFALRQQATVELTRIGRPATAQLREATRHEHLEISTRARQLLKALYLEDQPRKWMRPRLEAALLLARIGTRQSIPALRHALETGPAALSAFSASALRCICHGGPSDDVQQWRAKPIDLVDAWLAFLARKPARLAGPAVRLRPGYSGRMRLSTRTRSSSSLTYELPPGHGFPGGRVQEIQRGKAVHTVELHQVEPLSATMVFKEHELVRRTEGWEAESDAPPLSARQSWTGKTLKLDVKQDGKLHLKIGRDAMRGHLPILQMGLLVGLNLPAGAYEPGQSRPLARRFFERMNTMVWVSSAGGQDGRGRFRPGREGVLRTALLDHSGTLTYLGRTDRTDRYYLVSQLTLGRGKAGAPRTVLRLYLHGALSIDAARGVLTGLTLSGPSTGAVIEAAAKPRQGIFDGYGSVQYTATPGPSSSK